MADILVAEDYPATRSALRTLLKSAGHTVRFAVNGEEALAQVALKRPDLLLLDVMMPKKSGYEVLGEIRRTDAALPVILLTAKGEKSDVILGLGLGSDDYIKKPFDNDELLARVSAALRRAEVSAAPDATREAAPEAGDFTFASFRVEAKGLRLIDARGRVKDLFVNEYKMLRHLARHPGEAVRGDLPSACETRAGGRVHRDRLPCRLPLRSPEVRGCPPALVAPVRSLRGRGVCGRIKPCKEILF